MDMLAQGIKLDTLATSRGSDVVAAEGEGPDALSRFAAKAVGDPH
jgi:hypothetical protein